MRRIISSPEGAQSAAEHAPNRTAGSGNGNGYKHIPDGDPLFPACPNEGEIT
jgi:hypothetical protein